MNDTLSRILDTERGALRLLPVTGTTGAPDHIADTLANALDTSGGDDALRVYFMGPIPSTAFGPHAPTHNLGGSDAITALKALEKIGTLIEGAVPASLVTAGTFGAGAYVFPANITQSSGVAALQAVTSTTFAASGLISANNSLTVATGKTLTLTGATVGGAPTWSSTQTLNTSGWAATLQTPRAFTITGDLSWTVTFDGSAAVTAAGTLATVNGNVGSFGSSTSIPTFTVNAKGLITAASGNAVIAPAGTLTGTTLASNVVTSSLTTVGILASPHVTSLTVDSGGITITSGTLAVQGVTATTGTLSGLWTFNAGATIASGQTLTLTGATITGLTAASVGAGTFPSGAFVFQGALSGITTLGADTVVAATSIRTPLLGINAAPTAPYKLYSFTAGGDDAMWERDGGSAGTRGATFLFHSAFGYSGGTGADSIVRARWGIGFQVNEQSSATTALVLQNDLLADFKGTMKVASNITMASGALAAQALTATTITNTGVHTNTLAGTALTFTPASASYTAIRFNATGGTAKGFLGADVSAAIATGTTDGDMVLRFDGGNLRIAAGTTIVGTITGAGALTGMGTYNSQTISSAANLTGTLTVASNITQTAGTAALQAATVTTLVGTSTLSGFTTGAFNTGLTVGLGGTGSAVAALVLDSGSTAGVTPSLTFKRNGTTYCTINTDDSGNVKLNAAASAGVRFYSNGVAIAAINSVGGLSVEEALITNSATAFVGGGKLKVGNSASATVGVGLLANKFEVFDPSGTSLGFVPIYATIT